MMDKYFDEEDLNYVIYLVRKVLTEKLKDNNYDEVEVYILDEFVDKYNIEFNVIATSKNIEIDEYDFSYKYNEDTNDTLSDITEYVEEFTNNFI